MIYLKHPTLGNGHFPVEQLLELESQGWVWWPHGQYMTRPEVFVPPSIEVVEQPTPPEPHQPADGGTPIPEAFRQDSGIKPEENRQNIGIPIKRGPGRPRKGTK